MIQDIFTDHHGELHVIMNPSGWISFFFSDEFQNEVNDFIQEEPESIPLLPGLFETATISRSAKDCKAAIISYVEGDNWGDGISHAGCGTYTEYSDAALTVHRIDLALGL